MKRRRFMAGAFAVTLMPAPSFGTGSSVILHKDPSCGCCSSWGAALTRAGFHISTVNEPDMDEVKQRLQVPSSLWACHTAEVEGYFLEGHVPIEAVTRMLTERPQLAGLAVAGMPSGSLGMGGPSEGYDVIAIPRDGSSAYVYLSVQAN